ncbi:hypothetical protein ACIRL2_05935 [Embleya sp. NPDC127516]|uniref:hypothetical protein n=1 Tax=Embleya sp. NPDC127516 TaxID=3363990 RepID=UPI0038278F40
MHNTIEAQAPTQQAPEADLLVPLHLDYGMSVSNETPFPGAVTLDERRQITLVDGVPIIESGLIVRMAITSSDVHSDGQQGAIDQGQPDDATPNA